MSQDEAPSADAMSQRSSIAFIAHGRYRRLAALATTSFIGGLLEALFLVLVTRAAFAITDGRDEFGVIAGWYVSIGQALAFGGALVMIRFALAVWAAWQSSHLNAAVTGDLQRRLARAFTQASWSLQQVQPAGTLQQFVVGFANAANATMQSLTQGIVSGASLIALLGTAIAVDPLGAVVLVVSVAVLSLAIRPIRLSIRRQSRRVREASLSLAQAVSETSQLGLELHAFHVQGQADTRLQSSISTVRTLSRKVNFTRGLAVPLYAAMAYIAVIAALVVVAADRSTALASLGAAMLVMLRSLSYGQALQTAYTTIAATVPTIEIIRSRIAEFEQARRTDGGKPAERVGVLSAKNVTFAYPDGDAVLRDVTFDIAPREIVGIVGPSGGGKSTLVQLLLGLRDPQHGAVLADGRDIRELDKPAWSRRVTFVPQQSHLIADSIAENIRFMRDDVDDQRIVWAAKMAQLHEDVSQMPGSYQRHVGVNGGNLSGGQQQRLCIARALVEEPDVLILDEPTSALDVRSEHLIRQTLVALRERMTVIIIAHRLSTLDICDRLMVIQRGQVVGFDSPDVIRTSNEFYQEALLLSGIS